MGIKNNIKEFKTLLKGFNKKLNETKVALGPTLEKAKETTSEYQEVLMKKGAETFSRAKVKINQIEKNEKVRSIIDDATKYIKKINYELEQEMQKINQKIDEKINKQESSDVPVSTEEVKEEKVETVKPVKPAATKRANVRKAATKKVVEKKEAPTATKAKTPTKKATSKKPITLEEAVVPKKPARKPAVKTVAKKP